MLLQAKDHIQVGREIGVVNLDGNKILVGEAQCPVPRKVYAERKEDECDDKDLPILQRQMDLLQKKYGCY